MSPPSRSQQTRENASVIVRPGNDAATPARADWIPVGPVETQLSVDLAGESVETGPLPPDLTPGYLAAVKIAQIADALSGEAMSDCYKHFHADLPRSLQALVIGEFEEVTHCLTANTQEINAVRDRPVRYDNIVLPNAHLVCCELWDRLLYGAWALAHQLGLPNGGGCGCRCDFDEFDLSAFKQEHAQAIRDYFRERALPRACDLIAELQLEVSKVAQRRRDKAQSREVSAEQKRQRQAPMPVEQANGNAMKLFKQLGKAFFDMAKTKQAKLIGCHYRTWERTDFFKAAVKKGLISEPKPRAPKTVTFTNSMESVTGKGGRDEICIEAGDRELRRLTAEQGADYEPSSLEKDLPGRERKVHFRKRL
jgi:hypothetical protein